MKKILFLFLLPNMSYAQMQPADSLPGEYAGLTYYKSPTSNPWTIAADTMYIRGIDTVNCVDTMTLTNGPAPPWFPSTWGIKYTAYYSCNGAVPPNNYRLYYSGDSIKCIYDNVPQPPPNPAYSWHFFGKRISNKTISVNEILGNEQIKVFPNPCSDVLTIESKKQMQEIIIIDFLGREMKNEKVKSQIDVSDLDEGVYFLQLKTAEGTAVKKIVVQSAE